MLMSHPHPDVRTCDELVRCYFLYVHPFLPLLNAAEFLPLYESDPNKISQLLLWSVFFAAASVRVLVHRLELF
jgi:hypothetical protein